MKPISALSTKIMSSLFALLILFASALPQQALLAKPASDLVPQSPLIEKKTRLKRGKRGHGGHLGYRGKHGRKGHTGESGPAGVQGPQGPIGATGATGITGPTGIPGTAVAPAFCFSYSNDSLSVTTGSSQIIPFAFASPVTNMFFTPTGVTVALGGVYEIDLYIQPITSAASAIGVGVFVNGVNSGLGVDVITGTTNVLAGHFVLNLNPLDVVSIRTINPATTAFTLTPVTNGINRYFSIQRVR